jgi:hypothetical protein
VRSYVRPQICIDMYTCQVPLNIWLPYRGWWHSVFAMPRLSGIVMETFCSHGDVAAGPHNWHRKSWHPCPTQLPKNGEHELPKSGISYIHLTVRIWLHAENSYRRLRFVTLTHQTFFWFMQSRHANVVRSPAVRVVCPVIHTCLAAISERDTARINVVEREAGVRTELRNLPATAKAAQ